MVKELGLLTGLVMCLVTGAEAKGPLKVGKGGAPTTVESLRSRGPAGLAEAMQAFDAVQQQRTKVEGELARLYQNHEGNKEPIATAERQLADLQSRLDRMAAAIDQIGGQRSCSVSRLYWYTNLDEAKAAAHKTGRPILSLRMLGKLTDEFSCANSRFFRTALYSNQEISNYLRDNFVLHWQSVRPVPRVTIDFGDGRKLERTLTGNSAHYVLTADGQPLDVLPGLYGPKQFREWLERMRLFQMTYVATAEQDRGQLLRMFHVRRDREIVEQWDTDLERLEPAVREAVWIRVNNTVLSEPPVDGREEATAPNAKVAAELTAPKRAAEVRIMRFANLGGERLEQAMDDNAWQAIAALHRGDVKLDEASVAVMKREFPAEVAMRAAVSKSVQEDPVLRMVRTFEGSMTLDTVRNEYLLHRKLHRQFADSASFTADFDALNEWVYAQLFLTPSSDPWLGLAPRDVYTALENDGRTVPVRTVAVQPTPQ